MFLRREKQEMNPRLTKYQGKWKSAMYLNFHSNSTSKADPTHFYAIIGGFEWMTFIPHAFNCWIKIEAHNLNLYFRLVKYYRQNLNGTHISTFLKTFH